MNLGTAVSRFLFFYLGDFFFVINQRLIAIDILIDILEKKAYNNITLRHTFANIPQLEPQQRAFITDIVNGTLRNLLHIDYIINTFSHTKTKKMQTIVLYALRIATYEMVYTKTKKYAICNEAVNMVKQKHKHLTAFTNGVLRVIAKSSPRDITYPKDTHERLSVLYSVPIWIIKYLAKSLSEHEIEDFCRASAKPPDINCAVNTLKTNRDDLIENLKNHNIIAWPGANPNSIVVTKTKDISVAESFVNGYFHIMDQMSMTAIDILDPKPGQTLYDICAAPGGKSFYSAYKMKGNGQIFASDIHPHKELLIENGAKRLGIDIIKIVPPNSYEKNIADCVLIDAPCSGFGTFAKKPDIKYTKNMKTVEQLAKTQRDILNNSAQLPKPGGLLMYCSCTISVLENQDNARYFLENYDYELVLEKQFVTTEETDGFYVAVFRRSMR